jgi:hypothetical protein
VARPQNPDLTKNWKICLPAQLAGAVEFYLFDNLHKKPRYGARGELLTRLLSSWVDEHKAPENARAKLIAQEIHSTFRESAALSEIDLLAAIERGLARSLNELTEQR